MSVEHIKSALNFKAGKSSLKLLLLCIANMANAVDNCFYPSIKYLEEKTELNKKTIMAGLRHFESVGVIKDTGRRTGVTRQIIVYEYLLSSANKMHHYVYRLENEETGEFYVGVRSSYKRPEDDDYMGSGNWCRDCEYKGIKLLKTIVECFDSRAEAEMFEQSLIDSSLESDLCRNSAKTGTLYKEYQKRTERVPILDSKSTENGQKESQKRDTETKGNKKETKGNKREAETRIPEDWKPDDEDIGYILSRRPDLNVSDVAERFKNYWLAKAGKDAKKRDWHATWRTWVLNERQAPKKQDTWGTYFTRRTVNEPIDITDTLQLG